MRRKIAIKEMRVGMSVIDTGLSWIEHPYLYSTPGPLRSEKHIQEIIADGYTEAFIEVGQLEGDSHDPGATVEEQIGRALELTDISKLPIAPEHKVPLHQELGQAKIIYSDSLQLVKDCIKDARMGNRLDYARSEATVHTMLESVTRNADALLSLSKLRAYDEYTYTHSINVAVFTLAFSRHLGFPEKTLLPLGLSALFHDMGKARIPDAILNKPGKLTPEEFEVIKMHPAKGVQLLQGQPSISNDILRGVGEHHEKFNGLGYPDGLKGKKISLFASLISLSDVYDALTSKRVYKSGVQPNTAMRTIFSMRGEDFFPGHVERFVKFLGIYPIGSLVQLENGFYALVSSPNPGDPLHPNVKIIMDRQRRTCMPKDLDLSRHKDNESLRIIETFDPKDFRIDPAQYLL